jgi:hypothetical protein
MGPPAAMEVDEVEKVWEIEDVPARRFGSSRDQQSATEAQRHRSKKQKKSLTQKTRRMRRIHGE